MEAVNTVYFLFCFFKTNLFLTLSPAPTSSLKSTLNDEGKTLQQEVSVMLSEDSHRASVKSSLPSSSESVSVFRFPASLDFPSTTNFIFLRSNLFSLSDFVSTSISSSSDETILNHFGSPALSVKGFVIKRSDLSLVPNKNQQLLSTKLASPSNYKNRKF